METIITSLPEKLPESVRGLLAEDQPLPPGVRFFEERFTLGALGGRLVLGSAMLTLGVFLVPLSFYELFNPGNNRTVYSNHDVEWWFLGIGAVLALAGWMYVVSIPACLALGRRQRAGGQTRYGIFLTPDSLVWRSYFDTTVIPRENFRGLENLTVRYATSNGEKTFTLPAGWIGPVDPAAAIRAWNPTQTSPAPPPPLPPAP